MKRTPTQKSALVALLVASAAVALVGGCKSEVETANAPAAKPIAMKPTTAPAAVAAVAAPALKASDFTHTLTTDAPAFDSMPLGGATPTTTVKSGTMVLLTTPGTKYSKVTTGGKDMYVPTTALKPVK